MFRTKPDDEDYLESGTEARGTHTSEEEGATPTVTSTPSLPAEEPAHVFDRGGAIERARSFFNHDDDEGAIDAL